MKKEKQQEIALMRYSAIAPLVAGLDDEYLTQQEYYESVSAKGLRDSDGRVHHFAPSTIERWYLDYRKLGFDGLVPAGRADAGKSRVLDEDIQEQIRFLKKTYPRMSAAAIYRHLRDSGIIAHGQASESTVCRYLAQIRSELNASPVRDLRRYERPHINEVWCGDTTYGPKFTDKDGKKHRLFIIALIDDASRFITGVDIFYNDNFVNLMSVMKSAVSKYGRPKMLNFDNGASFRNKQMELLAARIGTVLHYCEPYTPIQKAKIERWFRTLKDTFLAQLDMKDFHTLDEIRGSLFSYVQQYNQKVHSSLKGLSPQDRFFSESELIHRLTPEQIEKDFLLEIKRRVSPDSVISIDQIEYEVDCRFAKQRITIRYTPEMDAVYVVEANDSLTPIRLLNKQENAVTKREKVRLYKEEE